MIRAAIVGVSGYGRWHLLMAMDQALAGRIRLVGAAVINQTEEAAMCVRLRGRGVVLFDGFDALLQGLAGSLDLILIPTGIQWHAPMTIAALRAGVHVLVEKPIVATLQEVDAVVEAQAASGRIVAVGFQDLYVPSAHDLKRSVLGGEIGRLRQVIVNAQWPRRAAYYSRNAWAGRLRVDNAWVLDSPANNALAHFLMLALFWAGDEPATAAVVAELEAELYRSQAIESFDTVSLRARTTGGVDVLFYGTHAGQEDRPPEIRLVGDRGEIVWTYERDYTISCPGQPKRRFTVPDQLDTRLSVLEAVTRRIAGEQTFIVEPALARVHTRVINALHEFFPVWDVAAEHVETSAEPVFHRIRNLAETIATAKGGRVLFGETGAPWARSARPRSLAGYEAFGGCFAAPSSLSSRATTTTA